jgi:Domain of unknown function (DUF4112)
MNDFGKLDSKHAKALLRLRQLSLLLDNAIRIPGTNYRVGLDPLIGLVPAGGDLLSGFLAIYIVYEAARLGVPAATIARMGSNVVFDLVSGTFPVIGDLLDVTWKANSRNVALLEQHIEAPLPSGRTDKLWAVGMIVALVFIVIGAASLTAWVMHWLWKGLQWLNT